MICPSKICKSEIPDDSLYCDQCGIKILRCQKCDSIGLGKFCGKCGGAMAFNPPGAHKLLATEEKTVEAMPNDDTVASAEAPVPSKVQPFQPQSSGTQIISLDTAGTSLELCHNDGWSLAVKDGNILGRTTGEFVSRLGAFPVISFRHAQISFKAGKWYITDLHSTNRSYINNECLAPDSPTEINNGDILTLANVSFIARIS